MCGQLTPMGRCSILEKLCQDKRLWGISERVDKVGWVPRIRLLVSLEKWTYHGKSSKPNILDVVLKLT